MLLTPSIPTGKPSSSLNTNDFSVPSYMSGSQHNTSGWLQLVWNPDLHLHH